MSKADEADDLGPQQRDGRPVEERETGKPEEAEEETPDEETIESVGY